MRGVPAGLVYEHRLALGYPAAALGQRRPLIGPFRFLTEQHDPPSKPASRSVCAAFAPANPAPTITNTCGFLIGFSPCDASSWLGRQWLGQRCVHGPASAPALALVLVAIW